jgi:hypothetical protein
LVGTASTWISSVTPAACRVGDGLAQHQHRIRLVVFDADDAAHRAGGAHRIANAGDQVGRMFDHDAVVAGEVGLAFAAVHHQGMHLGLLGHRELGVGRKRRPAQADHAGVPDRLQDVLAGGLRQVARPAPEVFLGRAGVCANDNRLDPGAAHAGTQADELDNARQRRVVRHREPLVAARDGLAAHHLLADADDGARRLADVLRQRHRHPVGEGQAPYPALRRQLAAWRMHAALEGFAAKVGDEFHWLS